MPRRHPAILILPAVALAIAGCGGGGGTSASSTSPTAAVQVSTKNLAGLGAVLVNGQGRTLYSFAPDAAKKVTCVGSCAAVWPPLFPPSGQKAGASGGGE